MHVCTWLLVLPVNDGVLGGDAVDLSRQLEDLLLVVDAAGLSLGEDPQHILEVLIMVGDAEPGHEARLQHGHVCRLHHTNTHAVQEVSKLLWK